MKKDKIKIETYKGIDIFYNKNTSKLDFVFESREYERVSYLFEAREIIDEPRWEECNLEGYFLDGYVDMYIGLAKASRKDIKSGRPDWQIKGQYDLQFKHSSSEEEIFPKNEKSDRIYHQWQEQREIYLNQLGKLNNIAKSLKKS